MDQGLLNFWKNYEDVMNWGLKISGTREASSSESTSMLNPPIKKTTCPSTIDKYYDDDCSSDGSVDIDLEYLNFSKKTLEHQEQIEKEKRKVDKEYGLCTSPSSENVTEFVDITYKEEIDAKVLYGSKVQEIQCLENKLQSEFDTFCSVKKPVLWPGMAFNLSVPEPELHLDLKKLSHPFLE